MDYIMSNKSAWEEAFDNRDKTWGSDISEKIKNDENPFLEKEMTATLKKHGIQNKSIVQFCSNNGRELLSIVENGGMFYITKKEYTSKTFINFTHSLSEIMSGICENGLHIVGFKEFEYDISGLFQPINNKGVPLSYIIEAKKCAGKDNG